MQTTNARPTAEAAYAKHQQDIAALLGWLRDEIDEHAATAAFGTHWGHVGDLGSLRGLLLDALETISGTSRTQIERELDDLR